MSGKTGIWGSDRQFKPSLERLRAREELKKRPYLISLKDENGAYGFLGTNLQFTYNPAEAKVFQCTEYEKAIEIAKGYDGTVIRY